MAHYVDNAQFLASIIEHRRQVEEAEQAGDPKPQIPEDIGKAILDIATHLSSRPNFANYTFREEMESDGIENCFQYFYNFDPNKSSNPFAYFTQIVYYAFIRRIQKENRQTAIKGKIMMEMPYEFFDTQDHDEFDMASINSLHNNSFTDATAKEDKALKLKKKGRKKKAPKAQPTLTEMFN